MVRSLKNKLYFLVAGYFRFFARIRLGRWKPRIVVITGSNGKTTALHLMEMQLGKAAKYSHHANSGFGIPFDILGLKRTTYSTFEWIWLILLAPLCTLRGRYAEKIYVVEADCDRPCEGKFLSSFLKPEVTVWLSSARTHSQNFERAVRGGTSTIEGAISYEFGFFLDQTSSLAILNGDNPLIMEQKDRCHATIYLITEAQLGSYSVRRDGSTFHVLGKEYRMPFMLPQETFYAISAAVKVAEYFDIEPTADSSRLSMPPGRSSVFKGFKNTTIIDSSYNANVESVGVILGMVAKLPSEKKWLVLGDLTEQGSLEKEEHEKIARLVAAANVRKIILVGPRLARFALPILTTTSGKEVVSFTGPREALNHIASSLVADEVLVFKGARFLEGIIEHLLQDKSDVAKLCRRERIWQMRRKKWGL